MNIPKKIILFIILVSLLIYGAIVSLKRPFVFAELLILGVPDSYADIYGYHSVGQIFIPNYPKLCKIGFFIFKDKPKNADLILHIRPADSNNDLFRLTVKGQDIYDKRYAFKLPPLHTAKGYVYFFEFKPLDYPVGKPLYFYLESPDSREQNPIRIGVWKNIFHRGNAGGQSYLDGVVWDRYLAFENYYRWNGNLISVGREIFKRFMRDTSFAIFYSVLCLSLLAGIFIVSRKLKFPE